MRWFDTEHFLEEADGSLSPYRYDFVQRKAVESVIWLHDVTHSRDKFDLMRFSSIDEIKPSLFDKDRPRCVVKMATGAGKTKVSSLLIAWSFFHKLYGTDSTLVRNFLPSGPNIVVLDCLCADFDGLNTFSNNKFLKRNPKKSDRFCDRQVFIEISLM